jgi:hypothetical protein
MKRTILIATVATTVGLVVWTLAQPAPQPIAELFPAGALLYLEARDFGSLLADWSGSAEQSAWLASANYEAFSRSELFLKLGRAQNEFAAAAGAPADYALLQSVAGGNSALAMYQIGDLEFLYITRMAGARALATSLWKSRANYQTRRAGGVDYYVKVDAASKRVAGFAAAGDLLIVGTREDLIGGALELLARQQRPALSAERWFTDVVRAAQPGTHDLRMVYNLERLAATFQFRRHWIQRNVPELREFISGLSDLERATGAMTERRVMLRANPAAAVADESAVGQALAMVPDDVGFYRVWLRPGGRQAEQWIEEKLFSAAAPGALPSKRAPVVQTTSDAGTEQDLEIRIDQQPPQDDRLARAFVALREWMDPSNLAAMLEVSSPQLTQDRVLPGYESAVVLAARDSWDTAKVQSALGAAAGSLWSVAKDASWHVNADGVAELDGLGRLAAVADGRWLVIGNSPQLVRAIAARRNRAAAAGAVYAAGWRRSREFPLFERMMTLIDFPQIPPAAPDQPAAREPMFFSENIASLGRALPRVESVSVERHDAGAMLRETVTYRIAP